jgi:ribose-phosphate pyrophosphokinase
MDLHADQIQGFFDIPVDNIYASPVLLGDLRQKNYEDLIVVSPDVGGVVRARALAKQLGCDLAIIDKRRPKANVSEVMHVIGEIEGRNCVIMDDMIDTAGTLVKAAEVLKERGAKKVYAYCTHPIFSGPAIERIAKARAGRVVVVTNTIPLSDAARPAARSASCPWPAVRRDHPAHRRGESVMSLFSEETRLRERGTAKAAALFQTGRTGRGRPHQEFMKFVAFERAKQGTGASRRLRNSGNARHRLRWCGQNPN